MRRIVIDGPWAAARRFKSVGHLGIELEGKKVQTGVPYGLFQDIIAIADKYKAGTLSVMWGLEDQWRETWPEFAKDAFNGLKDPTIEDQMALAGSPLGKRLVELPTYRPNRNDINQDMAVQVKMLQDEFLPVMGIPQYGAPGWESQDLIFSYVLSHKDDEILIYSENDRLRYLLNDKVTMIRSSNPKEMTTAFKLKSDYNLPSLVFLLDAYCLSGFAPDNVPGIPDVSFPLAITILREAGPRIADLLNPSAIQSLSPETRAVLEKTPDWVSIVLRNSKVLSHFQLRAMEGYANVSTKYKKNDVVALCEKYQFKSLAAQVGRWDQILETLEAKTNLEAVQTAKTSLEKVAAMPSKENPILN